MDNAHRPSAADLGEVLLEARRIGTCVRVAAIDPASGIEVSVSGPLARGVEALERIAVRKLAYVLARREGRRSAAFFA